MDTNPPASNPEALRKLVITAFPAQTGIVSIQLSDSYEKAWQALSSMLAINETEIAKKIAPLIGLEFAGNLDKVESKALESIPFGMCQSNTILPIRFEGDTLLIATSNPFDRNVFERVSFLVGKPVKWLMASPDVLSDAILVAFDREAMRQASAGGMVQHAGKENIDVSENAIVKLGRALLIKAAEARASDLHIQPFINSALVRIRVDGELLRLTLLPDAVASTLIRHIKANSGMEPTNTLMPQDGRMSMMIDGRDYEMRVSTLPASRGERLVIRFLDQGRVHRLGSAGFSLAALQALRRMITRPSGLILMTGPTGSGKTSTLYGMLTELNRSSVNIITVENPVEYRLTGISQVEVNEKAGRSFSAALRSILRQDPDVVLIGEIRDTETAEIAIQAAMTGHLVLSTLHTNDAISSIPRLLGLGVQPTILADALVGVASQRLCRVLCTECKIPVAAPYTPEEKLFNKITHHYPADRPVGCQHCGFSGYKGRLPIVDILEINNHLKDAIAHGVSRISELEPLRSGDLKSMSASANRRIISGETTVAEALNAMGMKFWTELAEHYGVELDEEEINTCPRTLTSGNAAVLITKDNEFSLSIEQQLQLEGWRLLVAIDSHAANEILRQEENVAFVIMDIADDTSLEQAEADLKETARKLYWSRLPALVLFPPALAKHEATFRNNGMISPCLTKPVNMEELKHHVLHGHAR